jgi:flagellar biosynthesis protein
MRGLRKKAAALAYRPGERAPRIVAAGRGRVAEAIVAAAEKSGVPLCPHPEVVEVLVRFGVGAEIPEDLYAAVASILAFVYRLSRKDGPHGDE